MYVQFGLEKPDHVGFTVDVTSLGIFIKSSFVFTPGSRLKIELTLPDETVIQCSGVVVWAKRVPPALGRLVKHGMGIHLLQATEKYVAFVDKLN